MSNLTFGSRVKHAWNAFRARDETDKFDSPEGPVSYYNPTRTRFIYGGNEKSIVTAANNRIAMDVAAIDYVHVRVDQNGKYKETIDSPLNNCLTTSANIDQTGKAFIQDVIMTMFESGSVAIVPVETNISKETQGGFDVYSLRAGRITEWSPKSVKVELYNDNTGLREFIWLPKSFVAIIENPLYAVMNEPNSTMQRLIRKLALLDAIDEQSGAGKLDLIIQLPYTIKNESKRQLAKERKQAIEEQLYESKHGIAYTDATEKIVQLNRPVENNLMGQVTYLTNMYYSQLGISEKVFNGTADEKEMLNYFSRTINPIKTAVIDGMRRTFLTKTARTQGHSIMGFRDIFALVSALEMADVADSFSRNEITTANEIRSVIGMKPSDAPQADELRNKNMPAQSETKGKYTDSRQNKIKNKEVIEEE